MRLSQFIGYVLLCILSPELNQIAMGDLGHDVPEFCSLGQFLDVESCKCKPCPPDHFMPDRHHSQIRCYMCQHSRPNSSEVDLVNCTDSEDTIIGCKKGYFFKPAASNDRRLVKCYPCTKCDTADPPLHEIRPCGDSVDTLCCPDPNMKAMQKDGESGYTCHSMESADKIVFQPVAGSQLSDTNFRSDVPLGERKQRSKDDSIPRSVSKISIQPKCDRGHYLKIDEHTKEESCEICPDCFYMDKDQHTNIRCFSCNVSFLNPEDIMGCRSKEESPTVVGCRFNNHLARVGIHQWQCLPCSKCNTERSDNGPSSKNNNVKCCPRKSMTVRGDQCEGTTTTTTTKPPTTTIITDSYSISSFSSPSNDDAINCPNNNIRRVESDSIWIILFCIFVSLFVISLIVNFYLVYNRHCRKDSGVPTTTQRPVDEDETFI